MLGGGGGGGGRGGEVAHVAVYLFDDMSIISWWSDV